MRVEEREIKRTITIYIADDGMEFDDELRCKRYEKDIMSTKLYKEAMKKLRLRELDEVFPLDADYLKYEKYLCWFKIETQNDVETLSNMYPSKIFLIEKFPTLVGIGSDYDFDGEKAYEDKNPYIFFLSKYRNETEEFWNRMGYKVTFEKK